MRLNRRTIGRFPILTDEAIERILTAPGLPLKARPRGVVITTIQSFAVRFFHRTYYVRRSRGGRPADVARNEAKPRLVALFALAFGVDAHPGRINVDGIGDSPTSAFVRAFLSELQGVVRDPATQFDTCAEYELFRREWTVPPSIQSAIRSTPLLPEPTRADFPEMPDWLAEEAGFLGAWGDVFLTFRLNGGDVASVRIPGQVTKGR